MIDAVRLCTWVHREPRESGCRSIVERRADERLEPQAAPALVVTLSALELH